MYVLLESAVARKGVGERSYLCTHPEAVFRAKGTDCCMTLGRRETRVRGNPWQLLEEFYHRVKKPRSFGIVGFIGYEAARFLEKLPNGKQDPELDSVPDFCFMVPGETRIIGTRGQGTGVKRQG